MNRPTALFLAVAHHLYDGDLDAIGVAYDLVQSCGFSGFGRARRMAALQKVAPELAQAMNQFSVDVNYVYTDDPARAYRGVAVEIKRAEASLRENGSIPRVLTLLNHVPESWPPEGWRREVWILVNTLTLDAADLVPVPLYRQAREALVGGE